MRIPNLVVAIIAIATLGACSSENDPGRGGVTRGEAHALDDAAAALDRRTAAPLVDATVPADLLDNATKAAR